MIKTSQSLTTVLAIAALAQTAAAQPTFPIVDTGQSRCFDASDAIECPSDGMAFYGQDAQFDGTQPSYTDNGDGTVTDHVTGLI